MTASQTDPAAGRLGPLVHGSTDTIEMCSPRFASGLAVLLVSAGFCVTAGVASAGAWDEPAEVRILDGGTVQGSADRLAGIEITLDPGWKTYWRHPGDSGIAPEFDFSASQNVASVSVEWPAPELHHDGYGWIVGYADTVVLPLRITPADPAEPVSLRLAMHFGVCRDICVPAEAELSTRLGEGTPRASAIELFRRRVPVAVSGDDPRGGVVSAARAGEGENARLEIELRFPPGAADPFLLVEGPVEWPTPVAERLGGDGNGRYSFALPLPSSAGIDLRLTGVSDGFSFERTLRID
jgi:DsbC/DsbD-like thiol-disulfide interchange protein